MQEVLSHRGELKCCVAAREAPNSPLLRFEANMTPVAEEAVAAALASMAQDSQRAVSDSYAVDFGTAEQPELHILQWWKQLRVPAAQMKAPNACRMGDQASLAIYFNHDETPDAEGLLLCRCKAMNQGTPATTNTDGTIIPAVPSSDLNATDWQRTAYAGNMVNATPNTATWWVHTMRTILVRTKQTTVQLEN